MLWAFVASLGIFMFMWMVYAICEKEEKHAWGTFRDFMSQYDKHEPWRKDRNSNWEDAAGYSKGYISHSPFYVRFGGVTMVLYPLSYLRVKIWLHYKNKEQRNVEAPWRESVVPKPKNRKYRTITYNGHVYQVYDLNRTAEDIQASLAEIYPEIRDGKIMVDRDGDLFFQSGTTHEVR
jgi:hypothetical protein